METKFDAEKDDSKINAIKKGKSLTPMLDYFGRDLTKLAAESKLDPVFGRDSEIEQIVQILNKRKKNNPLLVGEPGTGKTAIVEGLAIKIFNKDTEIWLLNKRVIEINMTSLVSGTKFRGEFEQRMEDLVKEIEDNQETVITFIDEIHNVIGAGGASGTMDASNIIKPALAKGTMRCIGATTFDEYKKHIESEGAFERRFQKVYVSEPTKEETEILLNKIKGKYEEFHGVEFTKETIKECVNYADKYMTYRKFPDKAIDLLDEVASRVKLGKPAPEKFKELEIELEKINSKKNEASTKQLFEEAAKYRDKERLILQEIDKERTKWENEIKTKKTKVKSEDIAYVVSRQTGIPVEKLTVSENKKLLNISEFLKHSLVGQDEALQKVEEAIQRSRVGIQDPFRPLASFLFLGPTGVGKTLMAKLLASHLFHTNDSFIRIDMSEYGESHSASKLIGSPPGYIGHEDKGQLTEKVKNRPYSIILFDEIEKAHPDVFNIFLQILDEGKLTDSTGSEINFKNTIIIMTSNIGTRNILEENLLGFGTRTNTLKNDKNLVFKELEKTFKPEFLNRIDEKIVFNPLGKEQIAIVAQIEIDAMIARIKKRGYNIEVSKEVVQNIVSTGYDKKYGARPIKRAISEQIGNLIAKAMLNGEIALGLKYNINLDSGKIIICNDVVSEEILSDNVEKIKKTRNKC